MYNNMPVVNVGVDVNNYRPITNGEIVGQIEKYIRENKNTVAAIENAGSIIENVASHEISDVRPI